MWKKEEKYYLKDDQKEIGEDYQTDSKTTHNELINNGLDLTESLRNYDIGQTVTLTLIRKKRFIKVDIPLRIFEVPVEAMYKR